MEKEMNKIHKIIRRFEYAEEHYKDGNFYLALNDIEYTTECLTEFMKHKELEEKHQITFDEAIHCKNAFKVCYKNLNEQFFFVVTEREDRNKTGDKFEVIKFQNYNFENHYDSDICCFFDGDGHIVADSYVNPVNLSSMEEINNFEKTVFAFYEYGKTLFFSEKEAKEEVERRWREYFRSYKLKKMNKSNEIYERVSKKKHYEKMIKKLNEEIEEIEKEEDEK